MALYGPDSLWTESWQEWFQRKYPFMPLPTDPENIELVKELREQWLRHEENKRKWEARDIKQREDDYKSALPATDQEKEAARLHRYMPSPSMEGGDFAPATPTPAPHRLRGGSTEFTVPTPIPHRLSGGSTEFTVPTNATAPEKKDWSAIQEALNKLEIPQESGQFGGAGPKVGRTTDIELAKYGVTPKVGSIMDLGFLNPETLRRRKRFA